MTVISSGGGGGGGDDGNGGGEPTILDVYDYFIDTDLGGEYLTISLTDGSTNLMLSVATLGRFLTGTYNTETGAYTVDVDAGASINSDLADPFLGAFNVEVTGAWQFPRDSFPTAGSLEVDDGTDTVTVTVVSSPADGAHLNLNSGEAEEFFDWDSFEDLFSSETNPEWQRRASLAFGFLNFMLEQADFVIEALQFIDDNSDQLEGGATTEMCDAFPSGAAPAGIPIEQGNYVVSWADSSGNGQLGPGDDFTWEFSYCWDDDPANDFDDLIQGVVNLGNYTEVVDASNRVTRIGFESPGGVVFTDFVLYEVEEEPADTYNTTITTELNGGFTIVFTE
jgi:hypothetical protein